MTEDKKERRLTYMAITTVLIAVATTLSTFKGGSSFIYGMIGSRLQ